MTTALWLIALFVVAYVVIYLGMERYHASTEAPRQTTDDVIPQFGLSRDANRCGLRREAHR